MKYKKIVLDLIIFVLIVCLTIISTAWLYPLKRISVSCEEILLQDYENYYGYSLPKNSKTQKILEEPEKFLIIAYRFEIKNSTSKMLFIEDYWLDIPKYDVVYFKNGMDFYSYYEYKPEEKSKCFGQVIINIGDNDRQKVLDEVTETIKINMFYWIYYNDLISLLAFSTI